VIRSSAHSVIASMVRRYGAGADVGYGNIRARSVIIFTLGIMFAILAETLFSPHLQSSTFMLEDAEQSCTSEPDCFKHVWAIH
jgi:hypothetical protein